METIRVFFLYLFDARKITEVICKFCNKQWLENCVISVELWRDLRNVLA